VTHYKFREFPFQQSLSWLAILFLLCFKPAYRLSKHNNHLRMQRSSHRSASLSFVFLASYKLLSPTCLFTACMEVSAYFNRWKTKMWTLRDLHVNVRWSRMENYVDRNPYHRTTISLGRSWKSDKVRWLLFFWYVRYIDDTCMNRSW